MALFKVVVEAYVASRELDQASLSRLVWWIDVLGEKELTAISEADIDAAMVKLAERGRLRAGRGMTTKAIGKPLAGSTINRYLTQAGSIYKHAKRLKLVPRAFVAPTRGIERALERPDSERYLRPRRSSGSSPSRASWIADGARWPAVDALEAAILDRKLRHGAHPVLTWNCWNSVVEIDPTGARKIDKAKSTSAATE
jgi:hypothetical protein